MATECCCCCFRRLLNKVTCDMSTRCFGQVVQTSTESPQNKTPGDSSTPEPSTSHSCESSGAPKKSANNAKNRSPKAMAHQTELSCKPCLSHVRQEPQITQEFQRLLLSERVDQKEDSTHKHHVRHSATRRSQPHYMSPSTNSAPGRKPHSPEPLLPRSSKKKLVAPNVASREVCTFR